MKSLLFKNLANAFTSLRVACTPLILLITYNLLDSSTSMGLYKYFVFLYLLICTSDFVDGRIARRYGIETEFGATFDLIADFCFVASIHTVMIIHAIIPVWFIFIILDRFLNFIITSKIENYRASKSCKPGLIRSENTLLFSCILCHLLFCQITAFGVHNYLSLIYLFIVLLEYQ